MYQAGVWVENLSGRGLVVRNCILSVKGQALFAPISFCASPGQIVSIMGPSGAGKSSLLAAIAGSLDEIFTFEGDILLNDAPITNLPPHRRRIGQLFQDDLLFPHMTLAENMAFALPQGTPPAERPGLVADALQTIEMANLGERKPFAVSGGQRLRVALMRTLLARPGAILLDEPFGKLDSELRQRLRSWVFAHIRQRQVPVVMVTHDYQDAEAADAARVYMLRPPNTDCGRNVVE